MLPLNCSNIHLQKGLFYGLICENFPRIVICLEKQKLQLQAIFHPGLIPAQRRRGNDISMYKMVELSMTETAETSSQNFFILAFQALTRREPFPWQRLAFQKIVQGPQPPVCLLYTSPSPRDS